MRLLNSQILGESGRWSVQINFLTCWPFWHINRWSPALHCPRVYLCDLHISQVCAVHAHTVNNTSFILKCSPVRGLSPIWALRCEGSHFLCLLTLKCGILDGIWDVGIWVLEDILYRSCQERFCFAWFSIIVGDNRNEDDSDNGVLTKNRKWAQLNNEYDRWYHDPYVLKIKTEKELKLNRCLLR